MKVMSIVPSEVKESIKALKIGRCNSLIYGDHLYNDNDI